MLGRELRRCLLGNALHTHQCVQAHEGLLNALEKGHVGIGHGLLPTGMCLHGLALCLLEGTQNTMVHGSSGLHTQASTWDLRGWGHALRHLNARSCGHSDLAHDLDFLDHFDFANDLDLLHDDFGLYLRVWAWQVRASTWRWVRLAHVGPVHVDCELGQRDIARVTVHPESLPQVREGRRKAGRNHLRQAVVEAGQPGLATAVQVDELRVLLGLQDPSPQATEHRVGSHLNEGANTLLIHGLDLLDEANWARNLSGEHLAHPRSFHWVWSSFAVGVDRNLGGRELNPFQELSKWSHRPGDNLTVEGRGDPQALEGEISFTEHLLGLLNGLGPTREYNLAGAVVVGEHHSDVLAFQGRLDLLNLCSNRRHRAGDRGSLVHQLAALPSDPKHRGSVKYARCVQSSDLTIGVPGHSVGLDPDGLKQAQLGEGAGADCRLSPLSAGQRGQLGVLGFLAKDARWEDDLMQCKGLVHVDIGCLVPSPECLGIGHRKLGTHVQVLAPLPWKEKGRLPLLLAQTVVDTLWSREGLAFALNQRGCLSQLGAELLQVRGDDADSVGCASLEVQLAILGQPSEQPLAAVHLCGDLYGLERAHEGTCALGSQDEEFVGCHAVTGGLHSPGVLLHGDVEVRATKSKAGHTGATGMVAASNPWTCPQVQVEGRLLQVHLGVGTLHLDGGRQHLVMQRHHGLEQSSGASSGLCMANLRLHAAQRTPLAGRILLLKRQAQALELGVVTCWRTGPVSLNQLHGLGRVVRLIVGALQGLGLARCHRRVDALGAAVGGASDTLDEAVDPVAVALRVFQTLQRDHAQALTEQRTVGLVGERLHVTRAAQGRGLSEAHVHEDVVHGVDTAGDHQVRLAQVELVDSHGHCGEGRGAGCIRDTVGSTQVQAVGDASCDDVAEQAGEGALLPGHVVVADALDGLFNLGLRQAGVSERLAPDGMLEPADHGAQELLGRGHTQDHRGAALVHLLELALGGVVQDPLRHDQSEQLCGVRGGNDLGRNSPGERVKGNALDERAACGVGHVLSVELRMHVVILEPVALGDLFDEIHSGQDVGPESACVCGPWEQGADADDCDGGAFVRHACAHSGQGPRGKTECGCRNWGAVATQLLCACDDGGTLHEISSDLNGLTRLGLLQEAPLHPVVEGAHRWATPDLVVQTSASLASDGPAATLAQVPTKTQGHLVLWVATCANQLFGITLSEEGFAVGPDLIQALLEHVLLQALALNLGDVLDRGMGQVELVKFLGSDTKHGASAQDLNLNPKLEHVGSGSHHYVSHSGLSEQHPPLLGQPRLHRALVDAPGQDIGSPQCKGPRDSSRGPQSTGRAYANGPGVPLLGCDAVPQTQNDGEERAERAVVRVATRVSLDSVVLGDWNAQRQPGLVGGDASLSQQGIQHRLGSGGQEVKGNLWPRNLRKHKVLSVHLTLSILAQPCDRVLHNHWGQRHVGGGAHATDSFAQVQVRDGLFQVGLVGAVDQVGSPGQTLPKCALQFGDSRLHPLEGQSCGSEEAHKSSVSHRAHQTGGGDAVGHGPADIGVAGPMDLAEGTITEPLWIERWERSEHRPAPRRRELPPESTAYGAVRGLDDEHGLPDAMNGTLQLFLAQGRRLVLGRPVSEMGQGHRLSNEGVNQPLNSAVAKRFRYLPLTLARRRWLRAHENRGLGEEKNSKVCFLTRGSPVNVLQPASKAQSAQLALGQFQRLHHALKAFLPGDHRLVSKVLSSSAQVKPVAGADLGDCKARDGRLSIQAKASPDRLRHSRERHGQPLGYSALDLAFTQRREHPIQPTPNRDRLPVGDKIGLARVCAARLEHLGSLKVRYSGVVHIGQRDLVLAVPQDLQASSAMTVQQAWNQVRIPWPIDQVGTQRRRREGARVGSEHHLLGDGLGLRVEELMTLRIATVRLTDAFLIPPMEGDAGGGGVDEAVHTSRSGGIQ